ncbi:MAG: hypothetical protein ABJN34_16730 [Litoreibacter sp.]|uniref:hypothetical protein n=1 Tax=Litoreibacter sp. TaxID=1969459 RepID=UPI0032979F34
MLLPTDAYAAAGTLTVIASIVLVTCLPRQLLSKLFCGVSLGIERAGWAITASRLTSVGATLFLLLLILIGLLGPTDPQSNLLPLTIWTVWWAGVFVTQGLVFDIWRWVNPWTGIASVFGLGEDPVLKLPDRLAAWPAVVVLILFQLFLLADVAPSDPQRLGYIVLGYWAISLIGIEVFGRRVWLERVECFTVMFRLIGSLRPYQAGDQLRIGFPGWAALKDIPLELSRAVFCLVILTGGSFDGVNETFWWLAKLGINPLEFPGRSAVVWSSTVGLIGATILLFMLFGMSIWIGLKIVHRRSQSDAIPLSHAFRMFAVTLLPIGLGYHFAHYLVTFMVQIKVTLSTASDPFVQGWNLFGLGAVKATVGFLSLPETVKTIWLTQAGVVVFSHVVSILMAHHIAHKLCRQPKDVVLVQVGLTGLMIAYTIFGLWLLASPRGA